MAYLSVKQQDGKALAITVNASSVEHSPLYYACMTHAYVDL